MGLSIRVSLAAYARAVGGVYGLPLLCLRRCACFLYVESGLCLFLVCLVCWLGLFGWVACLEYVGFLFQAVAPSPMFRGGAVRFSVCLGALASCNYSWLFVGHCPFGNKFLIIQKKKKKHKGDPCFPLGAMVLFKSSSASMRMHTS